jgi:predicted dehydrogenase
MGLRAIVVGTGWAGEGHALAMQSAGVEIVAICGRRAEIAQSLAARLGISDFRLDWRKALSDIRPDIVAVATPGGAHREITVAAAEAGCNVFCDKPMGVDASDARAMLAAVGVANVKHAYGASSCLEPVFSVARELVAEGLLGDIFALDVQVQMGLSTLLPFSWFHELRQGGGMLNQIFTHGLAQALFVTGGRSTEVHGEARCLVPRAPVGPAIHDFRQWFNPVEDINESTVWRPIDADTDYSAMVRIELPQGTSATACLCGSLTAVSPYGGGLFAVMGSKGTLVVEGSGDGKALRHKDAASSDWRTIAVPTPSDPWWLASDSNELHNWKALAQRFVADIRGDPHGPYPNFEDGCDASEAIDRIRLGRGWSPIPSKSRPALAPTRGMF